MLNGMCNISLWTLTRELHGDGDNGIPQKSHWDGNRYHGILWGCKQMFWDFCWDVKDMQK